MKVFSVRLPEDVYEELEFLTTLLKVSKNDLIINLIRVQYDTYSDDPKIKKFMRAFDELQEVLKKFE